MQIKRYSSGTNGIAKHPQPDVRQFAGCLYFWSQMREIVQIINEGEDYLGWIKSKNYNFIFQWIRHNKREEEEDSHDCLRLRTYSSYLVSLGPYGIFNYDHLSEFNNYSSKPTFPSLHLNISWRQNTYVNVFKYRILVEILLYGSNVSIITTHYLLLFINKATLTK